MSPAIFSVFADISSPNIYFDFDDDRYFDCTSRTLDISSPHCVNGANGGAAVDSFTDTAIEQAGVFDWTAFRVIGAGGLVKALLATKKAHSVVYRIIIII